MRIREIYIEGFGKLSGLKLTLSDGLNVLKRENGFGKTTLSVFIKAMLYGLDKTKRQSITENDRRRYLPWSGGRCGGSLTLETGGRIYRIERTFGERAQDDTFRLYDMETGRESLAFTERIGEELFGIDADGFLRTVFLSEENLSGKNDNKTVAAKLTSLVGCDGDISSLDRALDALEEERKIYYKRGGGGEIGELQRKAAELDARLGEAKRLKAELRESEGELKEVSEALREAIDRRDAERARALEAGRERVRRVYVKQYKEMKRAEAEDAERLSALDAFFAEGIPTLSEIEEVREKLSEAAVLSRQRESEHHSSSAFGGSVSEAEYARAKELSERLTRLEGEISALDGREGEGGFVSDLPPLEDIKDARNGIKKRGTLSPILYISVLLAALSAVAGYLTSPLLYALLIPSAILFVIGIIRTARRKRRLGLAEKKARLLIESVTGRVCARGELDGMLSELLRMAEAAEAKRRDGAVCRERSAALKREAEALTAEAESFIRRFDGISDGTVQSRINEILIKRRAWLALSGERDAIAREARASERRADALKEEINAFLSRYKTVSDRPLDEIASLLTERETLIRSQRRTEESVRAFREEHGITDADLLLDEAEAPTGYSAAEISDSELSRLEAARALSERRCAELSSRIAALDGVGEEQKELLERKAEYEKRLRMITKAKELLLRASDSLTSKYLRRTKEAFMGYLTLISRELSGDFSMNASFEIMRSEGGEYKSAEAYSRGVRDILSFAMRLALIDSLYEGERPFVILDDPFAHLDDAALKNAKAAVKAIAREKQIIYLTCTDQRGI